LKGIWIFDLRDGQSKEIQLDLYEGILIGYRIQDGQFDLDRIDLVNLMEGFFLQTNDDLKYKQFYKGKKSNNLELHNGFEIQLPNKNYYVIKDLEDGNYLSIDDEGKFYGMFHDRYLIELIHENVSEFID
jgi:hypothetical protein